MKKFYMILIILIVSNCSIVSAERLTIRSQTMDITPHDGVFDAGTSSNPLIIVDEHGRTVGYVEPQTMDLVPNDGCFDAGTSSNPYEIEWE